MDKTVTEMFGIFKVTSDGSEELMGAVMGGMALPLVGTNRSKSLDAMLDLAVKIKEQEGLPIKLKRFRMYEEIDL